jgi:hypothetical protein
VNWQGGKEEEGGRATEAAIALAEYQKNAEKAEADKREAERTEFKKWEDVDIALRKANAKVQRESKAKARKEEWQRRGWSWRRQRDQRSAGRRKGRYR